MSEPGQGSRRVRAGHRDRERAVRLLSDHFAEGRLDPEEFDQRVTAAYAAVHLDELQALFVDLPGFGAAFAGGPAGGPVPAYRADTRWSPPPPSRSPYDRPGRGPQLPPGVVGMMLTVAVVVIVGLLVIVTRGVAILPLIFVALPFVFGGARRRRPPR